MIVDLREIEKKAGAYAHQVFSTVAFSHMPSDEDAYALLAGIIVRELARAYAAGYADAAMATIPKGRRR